MSEPIHYDVVTVGAGPAGLFCAIECAAKGAKVALLEKNTRAGKKFLMTGSGQCNLTNAKPMDHFLLSYGSQGKFVKPALYHYPNTRLVEFFQSRGIELVELHQGKIFPNSMRAGDLLKVLLLECEKRRVSIYYQEPLQQCRYENSRFHLQTPHHTFTSDFLVLTTGGASYPVTGSTGDGYPLAVSLGHTLIEPRPALAPLRIQNYPFGECAGNSLKDVPIHLYRDNKKIRETRGDVLFTQDGLSGPGILDFSRYISPGDRIVIRLLDTNDRKLIDDALLRECGLQKNKSLKNILQYLPLSGSLVQAILELLQIDPTVKGTEVTREDRKKLTDTLFELPLTVQSPGDWDEAMATAGGVPTQEINPKTMESKIMPGLFFAGEIIDVDGDTGGYNLQFAFSSACLAGEAITRIINNKKEFT